MYNFDTLVQIPQDHAIGGVPQNCVYFRPLTMMHVRHQSWNLRWVDFENEGENQTPHHMRLIATHSHNILVNRCACIFATHSATFALISTISYNTVSVAWLPELSVVCLYVERVTRFVWLKYRRNGSFTKFFALGMAVIFGFADCEGWSNLFLLTIINVPFSVTRPHSCVVNGMFLWAETEERWDLNSEKSKYSRH